MLNSQSERRGSSVPALSRTEHIVIFSLAKGMHSKEIAVVIGRSAATVEGYIRMLFVKLNASTRAHLVAAAYENGLLELGRTELPATSADTGDLERYGTY